MLPAFSFVNVRLQTNSHGEEVWSVEHEDKIFFFTDQEWEGRRKVFRGIRKRR